METRQEQWRPVVGYEDLYEVSNTGRVRALPRKWILGNGGHREHSGLELRPFVDKNGYLKVGLSYVGARQKNKMVHRLVAEAFVGRSGEGDQVNHINGVKNDNRAENLEWVTCRENIHHAHRSGMVPVKASAKLVLDPETGIYYVSMADACRSMGLNKSTGYARIQRGINRFIYV